MAEADALAPSARVMAAGSDPVGTIPRDYNFATDLLSKATRPDKVAYIDPRGTWTYGQLASRVERFSLALHQCELRREERVLICLLDTIDWPTAFLGTLHAGMVAVPVNTLFTEDEYAFMLADSRAKALVVSDALYPKFARLIDSGAFPHLQHVIVSGELPPSKAPGFWRRTPQGAPPHQSLEKLIDGVSGRESYRPPPTTRDDIAFWLYTSGSTGKPKGAVHVHADPRLTNDLYAVPTIGLTENDIVYSVAKLFFAYGLGNAMTFPLSVGATTVLLPDRPTPEAVAALLKKHGVTVFFGVPTFYAGFLASAAAPQRSELKLRCCVSAGEALPPDLGRRWSERYGVDILDGLGSTEMLHIFLSNRAGEVKYGTSGKPVPGYDLKIIGDDGEPAKKGEMGELLVKGPTSAVMYWNNREQSRSTFLGEWTRSGDKYVEDEDGYFVYCGRRDDMLKVSGIYVSPFEVEGALQSHPEVLEAAVVAWLDGEGLVKPKAFVVLKSADKAGDEMARLLQDHVKNTLAPYKYPRWIEFRSDLPKTATGKIQRFKLRAEGAG